MKLDSSIPENIEKSETEMTGKAKAIKSLDGFP
jgi:hypothetical protein